MKIVLTLISPFLPGFAAAATPSAAIVPLVTPAIAYKVHIDGKGNAIVSIKNPGLSDVCIAQISAADGVALDDPFSVVGADDQHWQFIGRRNGSGKPLRLKPSKSAVMRANLLSSYAPPAGANKGLGDAYFIGKFSHC